MKPVFTVRVYGILIENNQILVSDEIHHKQLITKIPGGGLQFGEGTLDCVKREFVEELQIHVEVNSHFYTTDFFQPSAFDANVQVISIYYKVSCVDASVIKISKEKLALDNHLGLVQGFRWVSLERINQNVFTFPIDKHVGELLNKEFTVRKT